jgi:hypothetical protein
MVCVSDPMPAESAAGSNPRQATSAVIMIDAGAAGFAGGFANVHSFLA